MHEFHKFSLIILLKILVKQWSLYYLSLLYIYLLKKVVSSHADLLQINECLSCFSFRPCCKRRLRNNGPEGVGCRLLCLEKRGTWFTNGAFCYRVYPLTTKFLWQHFLCTYMYFKPKSSRYAITENPCTVCSDVKCIDVRIAGEILYHRQISLCQYSRQEPKYGTGKHLWL